MLRLINLAKEKPEQYEIEKIENLYNTAFPKEEKIPFFWLVELSALNNMEFLAAYDDGIFVGFLYVVNKDDLAYIFYYAISENVRGKGYGSKILRLFVKDKKRVILAVEPIDEEAENIINRKRRLEFYERNNFVGLDYTIKEMGVEFDVLSYEGLSVKKDEYKTLIKSVFGKIDNKKELVLSVDEMRAADAYTIKNFISSKELMKRAGESCFYEISATKGDKVGIVCGSGNNAGDGYVIAKYLHDEGIETDIILLSDRFSEDGKYFFDKCVDSGMNIKKYGKEIDFNKYNYIIDCIYGTGFKGEVGGTVCECIKKINAVNRKRGISGSALDKGDKNIQVISIDINSGMNGDTGEAKLCIHSELTVSIGYKKQGQVLKEAKKYMKKLINCDIGIRLENYGINRK